MNNLVILLAINILATVKGDDVFPVGDPRRCVSMTSEGKLGPVLRFEVLPGGGWDNLRNKEMGMIMGLNYSKCRTTDDGRFLIPDGVFTIPLKSSNVETYAELIEHWSNFTSTLSRSVNLHAGLSLSHVGISGSFSAEYESVKSRQHFDKSVTTRVQVRYVQYTAKMEPDTRVNDVFRARLRKIAAHLMLNRTDLARYESQLLVRDFGTHVITSIDVGAALVQVDDVSATYVKKYDANKQTITASASASFFGVFDFGAKYESQSTQTMVDEYKKQRTTSKVMTFGGPIFRPVNFTADNWSASIQDDLVALDRNGDPIYFEVNSVNLPDVPDSMVFDVYDHVKEAVDLYYEHNMHRGCTKEDAPNFSFQANVDDGSCKPPKTNFTFGGVYQSCQGSGYVNLCANVIQKNPQTGAESCPKGYEAVPMQDGSKYQSETRRECHSCWLFFSCCDSNTYTARAQYSAFWCAATEQVEQNSGFLFGGLYTSTTPNVLTQNPNCPPEFYPLHLLSDLTICVSDDYELGYRYSLPFAGFFSCKAGNPLTLRKNLLQSGGKKNMLTSFMVAEGMQSYPRHCPDGYSQHLAEVDNGCSINYCIKAGALSAQGLPKVQRPPFMKAPRPDGFTEIEDNSVVLSEDGTLFTSQENAEKVVPAYMKAHGMDPNGNKANAMNSAYSADSSSPSGSDGLSGGSIAAISVSATLVCVVVGGAIVLALKRRKKQRPYRESDPWEGTAEQRNINRRNVRGYGQLENTETVSTVVTQA